MGFFDFMTEDIAIDLGTANTLIIHKGKVVVDSPSIVAIDRTTNKYISLSNDEEAHLTYLRQEFANNNLKVNNAIDAEHVRLYLQDNSKSNIKKRSVLLNLH